MAAKRPVARRTRPATGRPAAEVLDRLQTQHPNAWTELAFSNAYELLVATILSAQCTDARVNQVTPGLFARFPTPAALAAATTDELEPQLQPTGFFRMKSKSLLGMSRALVETHSGEVPADMDALVNARSKLIATLDSFRDTLEDLGGGLGVTDAVSGPVVLALK